MKYLLFGTITLIFVFVGIYVGALLLMFVVGAILRRMQ